MGDYSSQRHGGEREDGNETHTFISTLNFIKTIRATSGGDMCLFKETIQNQKKPACVIIAAEDLPMRVSTVRINIKYEENGKLRFAGVYQKIVEIDEQTLCDMCKIRGGKREAYVLREFTILGCEIVPLKTTFFKTLYKMHRKSVLNTLVASRSLCPFKIGHEKPLFIEKESNAEKCERVLVSMFAQHQFSKISPYFFKTCLLDNAHLFDIAQLSGLSSLESDAFSRLLRSRDMRCWLPMSKRNEAQLAHTMIPFSSGDSERTMTNGNVPFDYLSSFLKESKVSMETARNMIRTAWSLRRKVWEGNTLWIHADVITESLLRLVELGVFILKDVSIASESGETTSKKVMSSYEIKLMYGSTMKQITSLQRSGQLVFYTCNEMSHTWTMNQDARIQKDRYQNKCIEEVFDTLLSAEKEAPCVEKEQLYVYCVHNAHDKCMMDKTFLMYTRGAVCVLLEKLVEFANNVDIDQRMFIVFMGANHYGRTQWDIVLRLFELRENVGGICMTLSTRFSCDCSNSSEEESNSNIMNPADDSLLSTFIGPAHELSNGDSTHEDGEKKSLKPITTVDIPETEERVCTNASHHFLPSSLMGGCHYSEFKPLPHTIRGLGQSPAVLSSELYKAIANRLERLEAMPDRFSPIQVLCGSERDMRKIHSRVGIETNRFKVGDRVIMNVERTIGVISQLCILPYGCLAPSSANTATTSTTGTSRFRPMLCYSLERSGHGFYNTGHQQHMCCHEGRSQPGVSYIRSFYRTSNHPISHAEVLPLSWFPHTFLNNVCIVLSEDVDIATVAYIAEVSIGDVFIYYDSSLVSHRSCGPLIHILERQSQKHAVRKTHLQKRKKKS